MTKKILKLGKYRHYKSGALYEVIGTALNTETLEEMVIYRALYKSEKFGNNSVWVRRKDMFLEDVEHNGIIIPRFKLINSKE